MKRNGWRKALCTGVLTACLAWTAAQAAEYTVCADNLSALGLFQGTGQGYALDETATRAQAATMLVRLLGKESEALALPYTAPFTDVPTWAQPYVQYLYQNGLTTGATDTLYLPQATCTAQMYAAFALRALGYSEAQGDYTYQKVVEFAYTKGLYEAAVIEEENFLRDDMAAVSYTALALSPKGTQNTLLDRLVQEGAVQSAQAQRYQTLFDTYADYRAATEAQTQRTKVALNHTMTVSTNRFMMTAQESIAIDRAQGTAVTERTGTLTADNVGEVEIQSTTTVQDGVRTQVVGGVESRFPMTQDEQRRALSSGERVPVAFLQAMQGDVQNGYSFTYNEAGLRKLSDTLDLAASVVGAWDTMQITQASMTQKVSQGVVSAQQLSFSFSTDGLSGTVQSEMTVQDNPVSE